MKIWFALAPREGLQRKLSEAERYFLPPLRGRPAEANAGRAKKAFPRVYCSGKPDPKK
ncbi:MAG: hypothetical protein Q4G08_00070 [Capnocytophaga sp.]|nr:hypothetical protein [Capnocytophaga sp.]